MIAYDIEHLVKAYPGQHKPVNYDLTLQIARGEIFGLLGPIETTSWRDLAAALALFSAVTLLAGHWGDWRQE